MIISNPEKCHETRDLFAKDGVPLVRCVLCEQMLTISHWVIMSKDGKLVGITVNGCVRPFVFLFFEDAMRFQDRYGEEGENIYYFSGHEFPVVYEYGFVLATLPYVKENTSIPIPYGYVLDNVKMESHKENSSDLGLPDAPEPEINEDLSNSL